MNAERWRQVDRIFEAGLEWPAQERAAFLDKECAGDDELRAEVQTLLVAHDQEDGFMERPASADAAQLLFNSDAQTLVGQTAGNYKITRRLGAGGMGEVYLAQDTRLARPAALKLLPAHLTADEERVRRFRREALTASALNHPNIITVYEIGQVGRRDFLATEFVDGVTLRARMRGRGLSLAAVVDIALQIAGALAAAHGAGIIHRDIKPENVMLRRDGLVKVLDFGVAKYTESARARDAKESWIKTATGMVIGTTAYMSPEQARGLDTDARTDIWSLGVVLYEMVAGRLPFLGATPPDRVAAILEREPEPLSKLCRGIPPELERITTRALTKNREERYSRAGDLAEDLRKLRAALGEEGTLRFTLPVLPRGLHFLRRRAPLALAAVLLVIAAALVAWISYNRFGGGERKQPDSRQLGSAIDSLAVLPLVNDGGSADTEYLSDGITDSLINSLSQLPRLSVKARSSVFRYKGKEVEPQTVASQLSVQAILNGRVVQRGDELTLYLSLVEGRTGNQLWGEQYHRKLTEIVSLQSEIARDVSNRLRVKLSGAEEQKLAKNYTTNPEAYQLYLKGRYHVLKTTSSEVQTGVSHFLQAIDIDPSYALAYVGLADAYRVLALAGELPPTEFLKAKAAAQRALDIDDALAEAHAILGFIIFWYDWDWTAAENQFKRALELDPNSADTHQAYAHLLSYTGRHAEGLAEIKRARELDPLNLRTNTLEGAMLINSGQTDEALARLQRTLELEPNYWFAQEYAASAYIEKGMYPEAVAEAQKAREIAGVGSRPVAFLGYALAKSGKRAEARAELERLLKLSTERYVSPYNIAMIYHGLGDRDRTLAWLERGYQQREPRMVFLKVEPKWNNLRDDPRFLDLLHRVGFTPAEDR